MKKVTHTINALILFLFLCFTVAVSAQDANVRVKKGNHARTAKSEIIAIDVLLEPDAVMLKQAMASNARLRGVHPDGFRFDATHTPHITMMMAFVRRADLAKFYAAEKKVFTAVDLKAIKLEAFKYYYAPAESGFGLLGICARPSPELVKLQADIISAARPFVLNSGSAEAFATRHNDPALDESLAQFVAAFEQKATGAKFNPHVSTGLAPKEYLDKLLAEPFEPFTFAPARAAVFQLGPYGAAAKKLKEWPWCTSRLPAPELVEVTMFKPRFWPRFVRPPCFGS